MSHKQQIYDKEKVTFNLVTYKKFGKNFEVAVEPDLAIKYKAAQNRSRDDLKELLRAEQIFSDTKKGELAKEEDLQQVFQTTNFIDIAEQILEYGDIQLTSEHREKLRQEKKKKIVEIIHRRAINPQTNTPHPPIRIENAMMEAKVKIDEYKKAEDQIQDIMSKIKPIIPIKFDNKRIRVTLDVKYASKLQGILRNYGDLKKENWLTDGSYMCEMEIPSGIYGELIDELNSKTHGSANVEPIK